MMAARLRFRCRSSQILVVIPARLSLQRDREVISGVMTKVDVRRALSENGGTIANWLDPAYVRASLRPASSRRRLGGNAVHRPAS